MTRVVEHTSGVGNNSRYVVKEGEGIIGHITRTPRDGSTFTVFGLYDRRIAVRKTVAESHALALTANFPTETEAWKAHWEETFAQRKRTIEASRGSKIAELSRKVLDGSNSARAELGDLLIEIDRLAGDPSYNDFHSMPNGHLTRFATRKNHDG